MAANLVVFRILFLVLIAHTFAHYHWVALAHQLEARDRTSSPEPEANSAREPAPSVQELASANNEGSQNPEANRPDSRLRRRLGDTQRDGNAASDDSAAGVSTDDDSGSRPTSLAAAEQQVASSEGVSPAPSTTSTVAAESPHSAGSVIPLELNHAELCYLSNGGSSLTLTVNEATQVGAVIGTIEVNGDPSLESGNIELMEVSSQRGSPESPPPSAETNEKLRRVPRSPPRQQRTPADESNFYSVAAGATSSPVRLDPGTKSLVLVRKLDKEGVEGESSLVIHIKCRPLSREHQSEATTIPVRLLITDANDHAPEFVGSLPFVVNISETAPVGSIASRDILAQDRDSAGPFSTLHYRVLDDGSPAARLLQFSNPLDPTLVVASPLDFEALSSFTITIVASDQGEPEPLSATAQVQVNVVDFDDQNPKFLDEKYTLMMDETQRNLVGQTLQVLPRNLYAEDGDRGIGAQILYFFDGIASGVLSDEEFKSGEQSELSSASVERYLHLNPSSGEIRLLREWPSAAAQAPMTLVVRATQADNRDRYTLTTLTITTRTSTTMATGNSSPPRTSQQGAQSGIEFSPSKLSVNVLESVPINEKVARVRAKFLGKVGRDLDAASTSTTASPPTATDNQAVDIVQQPGGQQQVIGLSRRSGSQQKADAQQVAGNKSARPINYQILDEQTDHFGINGLGEIFVKRPLDYELRQEFKFRVLATYTKYSDICQVQINVLNVNDNKPKFTQPQYSFHLTESRLRSNLIGVVQAHDSDLNDTINYSLLGDHTNLFEINAQGQISFRTSDTRATLNASQYQFSVQASDSLKSAAGASSAVRHTTQARVNLHIAPQLIGRSLRLEQSGDLLTPKYFNARSLATSGATDSQTNLIERKEQPVVPSSQRSSVATIVSSLQHMARSVNFLEMPMSSALLLSALLAFLMCLLFIVIISMSVHVYRRHTKTRRRRQLTAAAHLRHAQMAARMHSGNGIGQLSPALHPPTPRGSDPNGGRGFNGRRSSSSSGDSQGSSPTNSTVAGAGYSPPASQRTIVATQASAKPIPLKTARTSPLSSTSSSQKSSETLLATTSNPQSHPKGLTQTLAPKLTAKIAPAAAMEPNSNGSPRTGGQRVRSPLEVLSAQLSDTIAQARQQTSSHSPLLLQRIRSSATPLQVSSLGVGCGESSLVSSLSSHSKQSHLSNSTDDSSVMHCGHYSVLGASVQRSPMDDPSLPGVSANPRGRQSGNLLRQRAISMSQSPIEAAIESLVRGQPLGASNGAALHTDVRGERIYSSPGAAEFGGVDLRFSQQSQQELAALTSSKPGIKAYRKLPLMGSLVRPVRQNFDGDHDQNPSGKPQAKLSQQDSAIGSDASSPGRSAAPPTNQALLPPPQPSSVGLMAIVRDQANGLAGIKWPAESVPQRVKRLTWDDELSCSELEAHQDPHSNNEHNNHLLSHHQSHMYDPSSSNSMVTDASCNQSSEQQHFLFSSSPCSPALVSTGEMKRQHAADCEQTLGSMSLGQNNCLDYTIVQSSQFQVDSLAFENQHQPRGFNRNADASSPLPPIPMHQAKTTLSQISGFSISGSQATFSPQRSSYSHQPELLTTAVL